MDHCLQPKKKTFRGANKTDVRQKILKDFQQLLDKKWDNVVEVKNENDNDNDNSNDKSVEIEVPVDYEAIITAMGLGMVTGDITTIVHGQEQVLQQLQQQTDVVTTSTATVTTGANDTGVESQQTNKDIQMVNENQNKSSNKDDK